MKAKLIHHSFEWLEVDFQPPPALANKRHLTVWHVDRDSRSGLVAMKLDRGTGIWDESGKLINYLKSGADLAWSRKSDDLLSLEVRFGSCQQDKGIRHALRRLEAESGRVLDEIDVCVVTGGVRYLVLNHRGDKCLATWLDQNVWGYVLVDLNTMRQLPGGFYWRSSTLAPPGFSLDDSVVVSCNYYRSGWWTDEIDDYWDYPSPGGLRKVGTISIYEVSSDTVSNHDVLVKLPEGWLPVDAENSDWDTIWGPEFVSEREFQIWLPDGSKEVLSLPLPPCIEIQRELSTKRQDV